MRKSQSHDEDHVIDEGNVNGPDFLSLRDITPTREEAPSPGKGE